jgi:hypothetical protein
MLLLSLSLLTEEYCLSKTNYFITNSNPDIIRRPVFHLKHKVSETKLCFRFQVAPTQLGTIDRVSPCLWTGRKWLPLSTGNNWVGATWKRKHNPASETLCLKWNSERNRCVTKLQALYKSFYLCTVFTCIVSFFRPWLLYNWLLGCLISIYINKNVKWT